MGTDSVLVMGTSMGATAHVNGETFGVGGFGIPIAVTGGRRLTSSTDSVTVSGQVNVTGGWDMTSATDSVSVFGYDQGSHVWTKMYAGDGATLGHSGDALNVNLVNAGMTFDVTVSATTGVTNAESGNGLMIQGYTGTNGNPITIRGEAAGAVDVVSNSGVNANVTNTVTIDDAAIIQAIQGSTGPIVTNLSDIKSGTNQIGAIRTELKSGAVRTTISSITKPSNLIVGAVSSSSTPSKVHNNMEILTGITLKNPPTNKNNILIGNSAMPTNPTVGYILEPGESLYLEINNLNKIFHKTIGSSIGTHTLSYIGS